MTSSTNFFLGIFLLILVVFFLPSKGMTDIILMSQDNTSYGCIDCDQRAEQSICNAYGKYGSIYSDQSIWNKNGIGNINLKTLGNFLLYALSSDVSYNSALQCH